jgi:NAD-dependent protein deacetylase/lipoamidase
MAAMREATALAELMDELRPSVVLTGAGISTESGIPDFRSPTGIWAEIDPLEYASLSAFRRDPEKVWRFYRLRLRMLSQAEPNRAHYALAELERSGYVAAVITQNIDLLHARAGSRDVLEVHGSIGTATCPGCRKSYPLSRVLELLEASDDAPGCESCAAILKPDVVFFEEMLPEAVIDRAFALVKAARLLLVVGSSLEVYPVAGLPTETRRAGGSFAIVNKGPTAYDRHATIKIEAGAGDVLEAVVAAL